MKELQNYSVPQGHNLGLKVVFSGGTPETSHAPKGFRWNTSPGGWTEAPDWDPTPVCGGGLHLWKQAQGDPFVSDIWYRDGVLWMAVEYEEAKAVDLDGKIKVPRGRTVAQGHSGWEVVEFIQQHAPCKGLPFLFAVSIVGDGGEARVYHKGYAEAGINGRAIGWDRSIARVGYGGTAMVDTCGVAIAGRYGKAIAGVCGLAQTGAGGIASVGTRGIAKAGVQGQLVFDTYCSPTSMSTVQKTLYVGQDGIKPDTYYHVPYVGKIMECNYLLEQNYSEWVSR